MAENTQDPILWDELERGRKYLIHHQSPEQRKTRESVMVFLGSCSCDTTDWSARPAAGTQTMPKSWIKAIWSIDQRVECRVNGFPAGERLA